MEKRYKGSLNAIRRYFKNIQITNLEIMESAKSRIAGFETILTNSNNILMVKNFMKRAIDESNFNESTRIKFKASIDSVIVGGFADYLEVKGMDDGYYFKRSGNICGFDGMGNNAFAHIANKQKYIFICPGFIIRNSQIDNEGER